MVWHLWGEAAADRLDDLREYLANFPDGAFSGAARKEAAYLEYLRDHGAAPGGYEKFMEGVK